MESLQPWLPVIFNLIVAAFIYGGLTARVRQNERDIEGLKKDDDRLWSKVGQHGEDIAGLKARAVKANGAAH